MLQKFPIKKGLKYYYNHISRALDIIVAKISNKEGIEIDNTGTVGLKLCLVAKISNKEGIEINLPPAAMFTLAACCKNFQ